MQIEGLTDAAGEKRCADMRSVRERRSYVSLGAWLRKALALAVACCGVACEPTVVIGQWSCPASTARTSTADASTADASTADVSTADVSTADASAKPSRSDPIAIPWSTGFESRFCDYAEPSGFCTEPAQYSIVTSPVKSGHFAAAFTVVGEDGSESQQSRCVRQGVLPTEAYYGAWYYIPATARNRHLWNLFHFQGAASAGSAQHGIWDVSLVNDPDGKLNLRVLNFLWRGPPAVHVLDGPPVPIASWFHIEFYLKRAKDATGEVALYQDGTRVVRFSNVVTDDTNWAQWYVGNLADALSPPESTLYVDDVTIASTLGWAPTL